MFYMDVRYEGNDSSGTPNLTLVDRVDTQRSNTVGEFGKLCTLLSWHLADPATAEERTRNDVVYSWQGNRNPFIDRPEFAASIFGPSCGLDATEPESLIRSPGGGNEEVREIRRQVENMILQLDAIQSQLNEMER